MVRLSRSSLASALLLAATCALAAPERAPLDDWRAMKYGFFVHYVWDGAGAVTLNPDGSRPASIDDLCERFDAQGFADDVASMGVEYLVFTAWHANLYPLFPSAAIERVQPGRSPRRDLLGDMIDAVRARGIRVFLYTHPEQPVFGLDYDRWNDFLNDLYGEVATRYGGRLDGLYLDENSISGDMNLREDFPRLERTIRSRAPHLMLMQNFYGNMYCADVGTAEYTSFTPADPLTWGVSSYQGIAHVMSRSWSAQAPRGQSAVPFTPEGMFRFTVLRAGTCLDGGGVFWAAGPYPGGGWEDGVLSTMQRLGEYIAPVASAIKNTYASTSYPTPTGTYLSALTWGVATRSTDDQVEYIHVLRPPEGRTLDLPPPADGKVFGSARLLPSREPAALRQDADGVHLTLADGAAWSPLDTVIELATASRGGRGLVNDTSPELRYSGRGWTHSTGRGRDEYQDDAHSTETVGDGFSFAFEGTGVELLTTPSPEGGRVRVSIDGGPESVANLPRSGESRQAAFARSGLPDGPHTLRGVVSGRGRLALDALRVTQDINRRDARAVTYGALVTLNDTDPSITYVGGSWAYATGRDMGELNADIHYARDDGDYFLLDFVGTGVEFLSDAGGGRGLVDFYLDGALRATADMSQGSWARNRKFGITGLPLGQHTLKGVKVSGTYMETDIFRVYSPGGGAWGPATTHPEGAAETAPYRTERNDDYFQLAFTGTGTDVVSTLGPDGGTVDYYVDGALLRRTNNYRAEPQSEATTLGLGGLVRGDHVLVGIKRSGAALDVAGFRVYR